ncbi:MAG: UbiA family prenyltransferase [Candidatus Thorarchaeota archaeon]
MMVQKVQPFRNLIDNIPKNIGLYSVGVMLLFLFRVAIDLLWLLVGMIAFLLSYSSIYVLNDLYDIEDDKKDERKILRKPLAQGVVTRKDAIGIFILFLALGLFSSVFLGLPFLSTICSLIFINLLYSTPSIHIKNKSLEEISPRSLKYTLLGLPLVLFMQILKIFLPWTITTEMTQFPILFAFGFSVIYIIIFKGYKEYLTIGESVRHMSGSFSAAIAVFALSMLIYPEPLAQAIIIGYILLGILFFNDSYLTDRKVLLLSPVYIFLGIIFLFLAMAIT